MKRLSVFLIFILYYNITSDAQPVQNWNGARILQGIKKLQVVGSVLYIAAHPDDENTRLIAYLANERMYRTGYLSLTRGDGGQNLIGDEQGVELGLIRTQELLAARRIDGGEQYFTRAYDFGFSKGPEETFTKWNKNLILSDVVWVIRKFQPDIIITRFPTTGEGGHGHHTASAILANEAFSAAADPKRFPEQLNYVKPWQAKRILWNTFNFSNVNTTSDEQLKVDAGAYNVLLGTGYGQMAAQSRSQHKSQGFGSSAAFGSSMEYFLTTGGDRPKEDIMDNVETNWRRLGKPGIVIQEMIEQLEKSYDINHPENSTTQLVNLYKQIDQLPDDNWKSIKLQEVKELIRQCNGLLLSATTEVPYAVQGSTLNVDLFANARVGNGITISKILLDSILEDKDVKLVRNVNFKISKAIPIPMNYPVTQPYWLAHQMQPGNYVVDDQQLIGVPDMLPALTAIFICNVHGIQITYPVPVQYHYTHPVKGEQYQPLYVVPQVTASTSPSALLFNKYKNETKQVRVEIEPHIANKSGYDILVKNDKKKVVREMTSLSENISFNNADLKDEGAVVRTYVLSRDKHEESGLSMRTIEHDHIPVIRYFYNDTLRLVNLDVKMVGKNIGYLPGAGDKVADVLTRLGYNVTLLNRQSLASSDLSRFDAIITGVRAYNVHSWLYDFNDKLANYIKNGGNLIVQYNTNNDLSGIAGRIGPYPFTITRNRITDENAVVNFVDTLAPVLNYPNKITQKDFEGWIQERSTYHAANWDSSFKPVIRMHDPGEQEDSGSLIIAKYGKGYFTYAGIVFFRQLPALVPGAIRLFANMIALNAKDKSDHATK